MASIISSTVELDNHPQADGAYYANETHLWDDLPPRIIPYGPVPLTFKFQEVADARAITLMSERVEFERVNNIRDAAQSKLDTVISNAIKNGDITETDVKEAKGIIAAVEMVEVVVNG